jgi:hypothetical protein
MMSRQLLQPQACRHETLGLGYLCYLPRNILLGPRAAFRPMSSLRSRHNESHFSLGNPTANLSFDARGCLTLLKGDRKLDIAIGWGLGSGVRYSQWPASTILVYRGFRAQALTTSRLSMSMAGPISTRKQKSQ